MQPGMMGTELISFRLHLGGEGKGPVHRVLNHPKTQEGRVFGKEERQKKNGNKS